MHTGAFDRERRLHALVHGYTTAFWRTAGIFAGGAVICGALFCSGPLPSAAANHRDPMTPPHLPGSKADSGPPPGRRFSEAD
jgi:hypothetical protein